MIGEEVIAGREGEAGSTAEEEDGQDRPVVGADGIGRIPFSGARVQPDGERDHPQRRHQVAVDVARFIVEVETAPQASEV